MSRGYVEPDASCVVNRFVKISSGKEYRMIEQIVRLPDGYRLEARDNDQFFVLITPYDANVAYTTRDEAFDRALDDIDRGKNMHIMSLENVPEERTIRLKRYNRRRGFLPPEIYLPENMRFGRDGGEYFLEIKIGDGWRTVSKWTIKELSGYQIGRVCTCDNMERVVDAWRVHKFLETLMKEDDEWKKYRFE
jgi:hypothetical protein